MPCLQEDHESNYRSLHEGVEVGASEGETESSVQSLSEAGSTVLDKEVGLLTPASTTRSLSAPVQGQMVGQAEVHGRTLKRLLIWTSISTNGSELKTSLMIAITDALSKLL